MLATLTEQTSVKKYDDHGNRMKPFDILFYQAATALGKIWRKNKEMNEVVAKMNNVQNQKLMAYREFEEDTNQKLGYFAKVNKAFFKQKAFQEMLTMNKKHSELKRTPKSKHRDNSPEVKPTSLFKFERSPNSTTSVEKARLGQIQKEVFKSRLWPYSVKPLTIKDVEAPPNFIEAPVHFDNGRTATRSRTSSNSTTSACKMS